MDIRVSATRQELSRLKSRVAMAIRGHKLLKDKRDQLMKEFIAIVHENQRLRLELEEKLELAYKSFSQARAYLSTPILEESLMASAALAEVKTDYRHIMNVVVPEMAIVEKDTSEEKGEALPMYGLASTTADLDDAIGEFRGILPLLVKLSEIERKVQLLSDEIEKTRRRVNALEYIMIPELEAAIKDVTMRLDEADRATVSRLMKIKELLRAR